MKLKANLLAALALAAFPVIAVAQFSDRFDTINPAWITNRYEPAGFAAVIFDGDSRLCLTIDQTGSTANRPTTFSSPFYNTQGRQRAAGITGRWTLSAQVYISSAFNTTTGPLARSGLWGHTGTTDSGGDYMIIGFTNESPTDTLNPTATDRAFRFRAYDGNTGNWFDLGVPAGFVFDAWHTLSGTSTGTTFEFRIDGVLVLTNSTVAGDDLLSAMIQGYNFGQAGSYSVYWDNVIADVPVDPVITNNPLTAAGTVGTPFSFAITATGSPTSFTASPLPAGLSIVAATGVISGTPTAVGTTPVLLDVTNATGTDYAALTITVAATGVAPIITNNPLTAAGTVGTAFSFAITATGVPTSYTAMGLPAGLVINATTGAITGTPTTTGTTPVLLGATNAVDTGNAALTITVAPAGVAPIITNNPLTATGTVGALFSFAIIATGVPTSYTAIGLPAGLAINATTGAITGTPTTVGTTPVLLGATNAVDTGNAALSITVVPAGVVPIITNSPLTATGTVGQPYGFKITASGLPTSYTTSPLPTGLSIVAATGVITGTPTAAGTTAVLLGATNATGTGTASLTITIAAVPASRIVAFSARAQSGPGDQTLIVGFVVSGDNKNLLVRGIGPTLASYGIVNFLADPMLTLYGANNAVIATNDNWQTDSNGQDQTALVAATAARVGAFALLNGSKDSALLFTVNHGVYTTSLLRPNGTTGVALTEIYDTDGNVGARLTAVSARMNITLGEGALIAGFSIAGNAPKTMLIRGVGPTMATFGVTGVLADPQIAVFSGSTQIASNDNWETGTSTAAQISAASAQVGEFPLSPGSKDAALLITLQPGSYTVVVTGVGNTTGVALVEVYDTQ